jgi:RNA polymerase sigma-70 factor (ECF subfamily)
MERERRALRRIGPVPDAEVGPDLGLRQLVEALPDRLRAVVLLYYYADQPVHQVAELLGRPAGTVKSDLFDARARLAAALGDSDAAQ